jgi:heme iron utilization protein
MAARQEPERDFHAEAHLLIRNAKAATLATSEAGIPHAALVTVAFAPPPAAPEPAAPSPAGPVPLLLLSQLALHTRQLGVNPSCALLLTGEANSPNPQTTPRLCLTGSAAPIADPVARAIFLESHPYASLYVDFADFAFWRVFVTDAYYIGGFGAARRLEIGKLIRVP